MRRTDNNEIYFDAEMFGEQLDRPVSYYFDATMFDDTTEAEERLRRYVREDVIEWTSKPIIRLNNSVLQCIQEKNWKFLIR